MSKQIKRIRVTVSYSVGIKDLYIDDEAHSELKELFENGINVSDDSVCKMQYPNSFEWIKENIKESDCLGWNCEIDEYKT